MRWASVAACLALLTSAACGRERNAPSAAAAPIVDATGQTDVTVEPVPASTTTTEAPPVEPPPVVTEPPPPPTTTEAPRPRPRTTTPPTTAVRPPPTSRAAGLAAYRGLGTWVDVYDWSHYRGSKAVVGPSDVDRMADAGVQTLYLQTAKHDTPDLISEPELLLPIINRAKARGLRVVAWYLPTLEDLDNDLLRIEASVGLPVDGLAIDIEAHNVRDVRERNRRLIELSERVRAAWPDRTIGAIVLPPVQLEVVNEAYWPNFPYREIAPSYDVWLTMGYWTDRKASSSHREAYGYTSENIRRLRNNLGQPDALVHPVGGIADKTTLEDIDGYLRAVLESGSIGGSLYDWRTTSPRAWPALSSLRN